MMISNQKMTYSAYHNEVGSFDRRSEKAQRDDIERGLDKLTEECDWWTTAVGIAYDGNIPFFAY